MESHPNQGIDPCGITAYNNRVCLQSWILRFPEWVTRGRAGRSSPGAQEIGQRVRSVWDKIHLKQWWAMQEGAVPSGLKLKKRDHGWSLSIDLFHTWLLSTNYVLHSWIRIRKWTGGSYSLPLRNSPFQATNIQPKLGGFIFLKLLPVECLLYPTDYAKRYTDITFP